MMPQQVIDEQMTVNQVEPLDMTSLRHGPSGGQTSNTSPAERKNWLNVVAMVLPNTTTAALARLKQLEIITMDIQNQLAKKQHGGTLAIALVAA